MNNRFDAIAEVLDEASSVSSEGKVTQERLRYLWTKARIISLAIAKFNRLNNGIRKFGASGVPNHQTDNAIAQDPRDPVRPCLLLPKYKFKKVWNNIIFLLLLWTVTVMPYRLCFLDTIGDVMFSIELLIDSLFLTDVILNFNLCYYDQSNQLVVSRKLIAKRYLKTWFVVDFLGCFPFQLISTDENADSNTEYSKFLRIFRFSRFTKIFKIVRLLKMVRIFRSKSFVNQFTERVKGNYAISRMIYSISVVLLLIHLASCLWYYAAKLDNEGNETWVYRHNIEQLPTWQKYLTSLYWVSSTLTTVGYGDIVPVTNLEKSMALLLMWFGVGFYSYVIGSVSNIMAAVDTEGNRKMAKIQALHELASAIKLPSVLVEKVTDNIYRQYYSSVRQTKAKNKMLLDLPVSLKSQLSEFLHQGFVRDINFLKEKDENFLLFIVPRLKISSYTVKTVLYFEGDPAMEVFFLYEGRVHFRANNGIIFRVYSNGSYFGEIEVINNEPRRETVQVSTRTSTFYLLYRDDFFGMLRRFPEVKEEVIDVAKIREFRHNDNKLHVLTLKPNVKSDMFNSTNPQLLHNEHDDTHDEGIHALLKLDTYSQATAQFKTDKNLRNKFLWKNVNTENSFEVVQNTFVDNHLKIHKKILNCDNEEYLRHRNKNLSALFSRTHNDGQKRDGTVTCRE